MSRLMYCAVALGLCSLPVMPSPASAQDAMIELYGEGVHRYFAGDYAGADQYLTQVIDSGSSDPRPYFFRGLTHQMLGGDGEVDFEVGARLDAEGPLAVDVGMALSRIQGSTRTKIETARRAVRVVALQQKLLEEAEMAAQAPTAPAPAPPTDTGPSANAPTDLFSEGGMRSDDTTPDAVQPDMSVPSDATTNPFGDDPAPPPTAETTTDPAPTESPFGAGGTDPFGTAPADGGAVDPFGAPSGGTPDGGAGAADPFGAPSGSTDVNDPFGAPTGDAGGADPFGTPAGDAGAADPFGTGN